MIVSRFVSAWRKGLRLSADAHSAENLDRVADQLALAAETQWNKAAEERGLNNNPIRVTWDKPSLAMAAPPSAVVESRRFDPIPGLAPAGETQLVSGQVADLHALYGGLRSGRLIIAGPSGSGKSGAAVLLVLAALEHRNKVPAQERPKVPVPVLLTAGDWNPDRQPAADWLGSKLQDIYPFLNTSTSTGAETVAALLATGRITVILDGLDDISHDLRPIALQALSEQATFRLVLLSSTRAAADAAASQGAFLRGAAAVELNPVDPSDAARYLEQTQLDPPLAGWQELTRRIRADPDSPLSVALNNPLALTLVRDTYQPGDSIRELLELCDTLKYVPTERAAEAITDRLLDRVLRAAYTRRPGQPPPPYGLKAATNALSAYAAYMKKEGTHDLTWTHISMRVPMPRFGLFGFMLVSLFWLIFPFTRGVAGLFANGLMSGFFYGYAIVLLDRLIFRLGIRRATIGNYQLRGIGKRGLKQALAWKAVAAGLTVGLVVGLGFGLGYGFADGLATGLMQGLVCALMFGLTAALAAAFSTESSDRNAISPFTSWRNCVSFDLWVGFTLTLVIGLGDGLCDGLTHQDGDRLPGGLAFGFGLGIGLTATLGLVFSLALPAFLAFVQLALSEGTPVNVMKFLNDAHKRGVLRTVGPSYQFRHAYLRDRLAPLAAIYGRTAPIPAGYPGTVPRGPSAA